MTSKIKKLIDLNLVVGDEVVYRHGSGKRTDKITRIEWKHTEHFYLSPYMIGDVVLRMDNIDIEATRERAEKNFDDMIETLLDRQMGLWKTAKQVAEVIMHNFSDSLKGWCPFFDASEWVEVLQRAIIEKHTIVFEIPESLEENKVFQSFIIHISRAGILHRTQSRGNELIVNDKSHIYIRLQEIS